MIASKFFTTYVLPISKNKIKKLKEKTNTEKERERPEKKNGFKLLDSQWKTEALE